MGEFVKNPAKWGDVKFPNEGSPNATTASFKIDLHYEQLKIWHRWTWDRFVRLARFLKLTPEELASIVCLPHERLASFQEKNHLFIGRTPNRAPALLLTLLEATVMKHLTKDVIENPFPNLGSE